MWTFAMNICGPLLQKLKLILFEGSVKASKKKNLVGKLLFSSKSTQKPQR